jgi:hypothetical protein
MYQDLTNAELNALSDKIYQAQERWYYRVRKFYPTKTLGQRSPQRAWYRALAIHGELCTLHHELHTEWLIRNYEYVGNGE